MSLAGIRIGEDYEDTRLHAVGDPAFAAIEHPVAAITHLGEPYPNPTDVRFSAAESTFSPRLKLGFQTTTKPGCEPRQGPKILSTIGKHIIDCLRSQQSHS